MMAPERAVIAFGMERLAPNDPLRALVEFSNAENLSFWVTEYLDGVWMLRGGAMGEYLYGWSSGPIEAAIERLKSLHRAGHMPTLLDRDQLADVADIGLRARA